MKSVSNHLPATECVLRGQHDLFCSLSKHTHTHTKKLLTKQKQSSFDIFCFVFCTRHLLTIWFLSSLLCCHGDPRRGMGPQQWKLGLMVGGDTGHVSSLSSHRLCPWSGGTCFKKPRQRGRARDHLTAICNTAYRTCSNDDGGRDDRKDDLNRQKQNMIQRIFFFFSPEQSFSFLIFW